MRLFTTLAEHALCKCVLCQIHIVQTVRQAEILLAQGVVAKVSTA